jgi:hypothetical protein
MKLRRQLLSTNNRRVKISNSGADLLWSLQVSVGVPLGESACGWHAKWNKGWWSGFFNPWNSNWSRSSGHGAKRIQHLSGKQENSPALIADTGPEATKRYFEFFYRSHPQQDTRTAYYQAIGQFLDWSRRRASATFRILSRSRWRHTSNNIRARRNY